MASTFTNTAAPATKMTKTFVGATNTELIKITTNNNSYTYSNIVGGYICPQIHRPTNLWGVRSTAEIPWNITTTLKQCA